MNIPGTDRSGSSAAQTESSCSYLVVDGFTLFKVHPAPRLEWLLIKAGPAKLVENFLLAQDPIQHSASILDVVVLHQHRTDDKLYVTHFARVICLV